MKQILAAITAFALGFFVGWLTEPKQTAAEPERIVVDHYLTDVKFDTIYNVSHDTIKLPVIYYNDLTDTITDSIFIELPINEYVFDTTLRQGDTIKTQLSGVIRGFDVSVERLTATTEITRYVAKKEPSRWCYAIGFGYGTGGWGVFTGIGYRIK